MRDVLECYKALGIEPGSSPERVRNAYIQLARFYDPERYLHDPEHFEQAKEKRRDIVEAYQTIRRFLPELQDPDYKSKAPVQDRDFQEMSRKPVAEVSKAVMGLVIGVALLLLFAWSYYIYKQSCLIQPSPSPVVPVE